VLKKYGHLFSRCDLSISAGSRQSVSGDTLQSLEGLTANILVDETEPAWLALHQPTDPAIVDIVMDNAGYELFTDLCLADFLLTFNLASKVCAISIVRPDLN
jgi:hypothetical protein